MYFVAVSLIVVLLILPDSRALIETVALQAQDRIADEGLLCCLALLTVLVASIVSWLVSHRPRARESTTYQVIRQFRVQ